MTENDRNLYIYRSIIRQINIDVIYNDLEKDFFIIAIGAGEMMVACDIVNGNYIGCCDIGGIKEYNRIYKLIDYTRFLQPRFLLFNCFYGFSNPILLIESIKNIDKYCNFILRIVGIGCENLEEIDGIKNYKTLIDLERKLNSLK